MSQLIHLSSYHDRSFQDKRRQLRKSYILYLMYVKKKICPLDSRFVFWCFLGKQLFKTAKQHTAGTLGFVGGSTGGETSRVLAKFAKHIADAMVIFVRRWDPTASGCEMWCQGSSKVLIYIYHIYLFLYVNI